MYNKCRIIYPPKKHIYTIILLHGMYSDYNTFNNFLNYFKNDSLYQELFNCIKSPYDNKSLYIFNPFFF